MAAQLILFMWIVPSSAVAHGSRCLAYELAALPSRQPPTDLVRSFLGFNTAFPQTTWGIQLGMTASYFLYRNNWSRFKAMKAEDVEKVFDTMTKAHATHGVSKQVHLPELKEYLENVQIHTDETSTAAIKLLMLPERFQTPPHIRNWEERNEAIKKSFFEDPKYQKHRQRLETYSATIVESIKSSESRAVGMKIRKLALIRTSEATKEAAALVEDLKKSLAKTLESKYPELAAHPSSVSNYPAVQPTVARQLLDTFTGVLELENL